MTPHEFKEARKKLGLTQQAMADLIKANIRTLQKWEGGESKVSPLTALLIKILLDIQGTELGKKYGV